MAPTNDVDNFLQKVRKRGRPRVAFVSGIFDVLHPGHLRLLKFAEEQSDVLIVGVASDGQAGKPLIREDERLQGVAALAYVDHAFLVDEPLPNVLRRLRPDIVIKGREWAQAKNEEDVVREWGGRLLFSSGEVTSSSFELLWEEFKGREMFSISPHREYLDRRHVTGEKVWQTFRALESLNVLVVGDTIVDEYLFCDALGMSQEDPVLVVRPMAEEKFVGGAAIVALHARGLGARVRFASVVGDDDAGSWVERELRNAGIHTTLLVDGSRPTTRKLRYMSEGKKLLRVSHLREHALSGDLVSELTEKLDGLLDGVNLVIFSDFSYGFLSEEVCKLFLERCRERGILTAADSQSSSQVGDLTRFVGADLITPTEREARMALHDRTSGLVRLAQKLKTKMQSRYILLTLGKDGVFVHYPHAVASDRFETDNVPALNTHARDAVGAGDALLVGTSLSLAAGADVWTAAYLGSLCAAYEVSCIGNQPVSRGDLENILNQGTRS